LVEACKTIPNIKLKLLGAILDDVKEDLRSISDNGEWLELMGERPYEEVIREMMACDVFVLPTYTEGFPNVILEAMACGCAIVTTPVGAIPEMLEEVDGRHYGLMVEPKNARQLHNAIVKMLENESFKNECRENVKQRVSERYNMPIIWKSIVDIWNTIIE
jgi:glycosyltransferase involved in cell wall biosynthesis